MEGGGNQVGTSVRSSIFNKSEGGGEAASRVRHAGRGPLLMIRQPSAQGRWRKEKDTLLNSGHPEKWGLQGGGPWRGLDLTRSSKELPPSSCFMRKWGPLGDWGTKGCLTSFGTGGMESDDTQSLSNRSSSSGKEGEHQRQTQCAG